MENNQMQAEAESENVQVDVNYEAEFSEVYNNAEADEALDWARQFEETPKAVAEPEVVAEPETSNEEGLIDQAQRAGLGVGRDVALGVMNAPRSIARGVNQSVSNVFDFVDDLHEFNTRFFVGKEATLDIPEIPVIDKPNTRTVTGDGIEAISQFLTGFKGVDKAVKSSKYLKKGFEGLEKMKGGKVAANALKGAAADMAVFETQEDRLSDMVQSVPALQNPVTEYLQGEDDDGVLEAKFKQGVEGLLASGAVDGVLNGLKIMRKARGAKSKLNDGKAEDLFDVPEEEAAGIGVDNKTFSFLGDTDSDDLFIRKQKKLDDAAAEVEGAFGKPKQIKEGANEAVEDFQINFARIEGPEDIKQLMDDMVNKPELKASIDAERRGVKDARQTLTAATDIDGFDELMKRRTGDAFNAETIVAARKVYYDTTEKLMEAAKKAAAPEASDVDQFNFRKMIATHHAVQKEFMGVRAEAGRALQAWNIPVGGSAENARALEQVLNEFGGAETSKALAKRMAVLGNNLNTNQINQITSKSAGARSLDAMTEIWTLGLLTNPTTHVVNISSNVLTGLVLGVERFAASFAKDTPVSFKEGVEYFNGFLQAQKAGMKNAAEAFRTGQTGIGLSKLDLPRTRNSARDILDPDGKAGALSKGVDWYGSILSKYAGGALAAGDEYSKTVLYQSQVRALSTREGISLGLEGRALQEHIAKNLADVPNNIRADAVQFSNYGTFTKELGKTGQDIQRIISRNPALRFVVPFVRTPANIFKFTFERTPLAVLSSKVREDIGAGGLRKSMALSKIGLGTSVMAMSVDLTQNGQITGGGPSDPKLRSALRRTGWQPYSVKVGDTYYSYSRFEPIATILGMGADMQEILGNYEAYDLDAQREADELVTAGVMAISNQIVGKTFLQGFSDLVEVLSEPGRYGERYVQRYAGSAVPAGVAAIERAVNPEMSQVFNMMDQVKSRIPGLSEMVPPRRNIWGEEIEMFTPDGNMAEATFGRVMSLVNPIYYSKEKDAAVDRWMLAQGFLVNMPSKRQTFDGVKLDLREQPEMYDRLVAMRGNEIELLKYGNQTMKSFFENLAKEEDPFGRHVGFFMDIGNSFDDQQSFINKVVRDYNDAAKEALFDEFEALPGMIDKERRNAALLDGVRPSASNQPPVTLNGE